MSTVVDYADRQADLLFFSGAQEDRQEHLLTQELVAPGESGALITGIQKLVQRFLRVLLTELGSMRYHQLDGTRFMIEARRGGWRTTADVRQSYHAAHLDARRQLIQEELTTDPQDERFAGADLLQVQLQGDLVVLRIRVNSLAGVSRVVITPVTVAVH